MWPARTNLNAALKQEGMRMCFGPIHTGDDASFTTSQLAPTQLTSGPHVIQIWWRITIVAVLNLFSKALWDVLTEGLASAQTPGTHGVSLVLVERIWCISDSQGQILPLAIREKS